MRGLRDRVGPSRRLGGFLDPARYARVWSPAAACIAVFGGGAALAGCGGSEQAGGLGSVPHLAIELDLRIDGYQADLVPVSWMGVRSDGVIALIQWQDGNVRFFDPDGEALGSVGRAGDGPGEFRVPVRGGWIGDTLWIGDTGLRRVTLISSDLDVLRSIPEPLDLRARPGGDADLPRFGSPISFSVYPGDTLLVAAIPVADDPRSRRFEGSPLLRASSEGVIERVIFERPDLESSGITVPLEGGNAAVSMIPFFHRPSWAVSPSGDRVASLTTALSGPDAGAFRIAAVDARGERLFSRAYRFDGVRIPGAVVDSAVAAAVERANHPELRRAILSEMKHLVPPVYSPVATVRPLVFGRDGRMWVGLRRTDEGNPWVFLGPDGEPRGRIVVPDNVSLRVADATHVWGLERDELDVESVVRFRVYGIAR